jgi:N-acetylgalactosamine-N,N'-diacetylbacillosaminyl-diphospho-undecaprenol 4-alpha-N-acetylgalactosaminyltransferase
MKQETPKRILFLINSFIGGGAERVMSILLSYSKREGAEFELHLGLLDKDKIAYPIPDWVMVHQLDCRFGLARSVVQTFALINRLKPAVTLSFLTRANVSNVIASRALGRTAIISEHVDTTMHLGAGLAASAKKLLVRVSYRRAALITAVSAGVATDLQRNFDLPREKIVVITNPVDFQNIRAQGAAEPAIALPPIFTVAVGRLVKNKNFSFLIDAFVEAGIAGELIILGEGPLRPALEEQIRRLGAQDRVRLAGFVANPFAVTSRARQFVLCSNVEGFPMGLVEALALGLPIVATNCPSGPSEILADRPREQITQYTEAEYGILVRQDSIPDMVKALHRIQDEPLRSLYQHRAGARAEFFGPEKAKDEYWAVLRGAAA